MFCPGAGSRAAGLPYAGHSQLQPPAAGHGRAPATLTASPGKHAYGREPVERPAVEQTATALHRSGRTSPEGAAACGAPTPQQVPFLKAVAHGGEHPRQREEQDAAETDCYRLTPSPHFPPPLHRSAWGEGRGVRNEGAKLSLGKGRTSGKVVF